MEKTPKTIVVVSDSEEKKEPVPKCEFMLKRELKAEIKNKK